MKKLIVICLALAVLASSGCGNKPDSERGSSDSSAETARLDWLSDPVDGTKIASTEDAEYSYVYKNVKYYFNSKKNYEAFKKEPEKYVSKLTQ